jgi:hypothetical protein
LVGINIKIKLTTIEGVDYWIEIQCGLKWIGMLKNKSISQW